MHSAASFTPEGNAMMKFYYAPYTCALASHIALEEAGAEYEAVRLDLDRKDQRGSH